MYMSKFTEPDPKSETQRNLGNIFCSYWMTPYDVKGLLTLISLRIDTTACSFQLRLLCSSLYFFDYQQLSLTLQTDSSKQMLLAHNITWGHCEQLPIILLEIYKKKKSTEMPPWNKLCILVSAHSILDLWFYDLQTWKNPVCASCCTRVLMSYITAKTWLQISNQPTSLTQK